jgi:hypothetical protein
VQGLPEAISVQGAAQSGVELRGLYLAARADGTGAPAIAIARTRSLDGAAVPPAAVATQDLTVDAFDGHTGITHLHFGFIGPPGIYSFTLTTELGHTELDDAIAVVPTFAFSKPGSGVICLSKVSHLPIAATLTVPADRGGLDAAAVWFVDSSGSPVIDIQPPPFWTFSETACRPIGIHPFASLVTCNGLTLDLPDANGLTDDFGSTLDRAWVFLGDVFDPAVAPHQPLDLLLEASAPIPRAQTVFSATGPVSVPLTFVGNFIVDHGQGPAVTLDGASIPSVPTSCSESGVPGMQACVELDAVLPQGASAGDHVFTATSVSGCSATSQVTVQTPPAILSIAPAQLCAARDRDIRLTGTTLFGAAVLVDGVFVRPLDPPACLDGTCIDVPIAGLGRGPHSVFVEQRLNVTLDSPRVSFTIEPGPASPGAPVPSVLLAGANRPFFIPLSGKTGAARSATLIFPDGHSAPAAVQDVASGALVTAPPDAPPGDYRVEVADESPCPAGGSQPIQLADSPIVAQHRFDADTDGFSFGSVNDRGNFFIDAFDAIKWDSTAGNPPGQVTARIASGITEEKVFQTGLSILGNDLGILRFDLSTCPFDPASPLQPAVVTIRASPPGGSAAVSLTHSIAPPGCALTHYDLPLDGSWTFTDGTTSRPATPSDFTGDLVFLRIPANFTPGGSASDVALDDVVLELGQ